MNVSDPIAVADGDYPASSRADRSRAKSAVAPSHVDYVTTSGTETTEDPIFPSCWHRGEQLDHARLRLQQHLGNPSASSSIAINSKDIRIGSGHTCAGVGH